MINVEKLQRIVLENIVKNETTFIVAVANGAVLNEEQWKWDGNMTLYRVGVANKEILQLLGDSVVEAIKEHEECGLE